MFNVEEKKKKIHFLLLIKGKKQSWTSVSWRLTTLTTEKRLFKLIFVGSSCQHFFKRIYNFLKKA